MRAFSLLKRDFHEAGAIAGAFALAGGLCMAAPSTASALVAGVIGAAWAGCSYLYSNMAFAWLRNRSRILPAGDTLRDTFDRFRTEAGLKKNVKLYIYEDRNSVEAISTPDEIFMGRGIYESTDAGEREAIVAHEVAHIKEHDHVKRLAMGLPVIFSMAATGHIVFGATDMSIQNMARVAAGAIATLAVVALAKKQGREMEYRADAHAALMVRSPDKVISALRKTDDLNQGWDMQVLKDAFSGRGVRGESLYSRIMRSYPTGEERCRSLMAADLRAS